jgi:hypothetical protein
VTVSGSIDTHGYVTVPKGVLCFTTAAVNHEDPSDPRLSGVINTNVGVTMGATDERFYDGFGRWSAGEAERVREGRRKATEKRKERMRERAADTV